MEPIVTTTKEIIYVKRKRKRGATIKTQKKHKIIDIRKTLSLLMKNSDSITLDQLKELEDKINILSQQK